MTVYDRNPYRPDIISPHLRSQCWRTEHLRYATMSNLSPLISTTDITSGREIPVESGEECDTIELVGTPLVQLPPAGISGFR